MGVASAIASTSMMSEMAIGMSLHDAYHLTPDKITEALGGLPEHKFHCSVLGDKALRAAIDDYLEKAGRENPFKNSVAKTICECNGVTDMQIEDLVKRGEAKTDDSCRRLPSLVRSAASVSNRLVTCLMSSSTSITYKYALSYNQERAAD